jgi:hypothetical protein
VKRVPRTGTLRRHSIKKAAALLRHAPLLRGAQARAAIFPFVKNKHAVMGWLTKSQASSASNCTRAAAKVILVPSDRQIVSARLTRTSPTCAPPATARVRTSPSRGASCVAQAALRAPEIVAISRVTAIAARWRAKLRTTKPPNNEIYTMRNVHNATPGLVSTKFRKTHLLVRARVSR